MNSEIRSSQVNSLQAHAHRNMTLMEDMKRRGISLDAIRPIDLHFWVAGQSDAHGLSAALTQSGFSVKSSKAVTTTAEQARWSIEAGTNKSIREITQEHFVNDLISLAAKFFGEFDGWGSSL